MSCPISADHGESPLHRMSLLSQASYLGTSASSIAVTTMNSHLLLHNKGQDQISRRPVPATTRSKVFNFFDWDESIRQWRCKLCQ